MANPLFGGLTPQEMIENGHFQELLKIIKRAENESWQRQCKQHEALS